MRIDTEGALLYYAKMGVYQYSHFCGSNNLKFIGISGQNGEMVEFLCKDCGENFSEKCKGGYLKSKSGILEMLYPV